jgi:hypothetical protein
LKLSKNSPKIKAIFIFKKTSLSKQSHNGRNFAQCSHPGEVKKISVIKGDMLWLCTYFRRSNWKKVIKRLANNFCPSLTIVFYDKALFRRKLVKAEIVLIDPWCQFYEYIFGQFFALLGTKILRLFYNYRSWCTPRNFCGIFAKLFRTS